HDSPCIAARVAPPSASIEVRLLRQCRSWVRLPTEVTQGAAAVAVMVAAPGPELPAETATWIPAARALRKARVLRSSHGEVLDELIEWLSTSTSSRIACSIAESIMDW